MGKCRIRGSAVVVMKSSVFWDRALQFMEKLLNTEHFHSDLSFKIVWLDSIENKLEQKEDDYSNRPEGTKGRNTLNIYIMSDTVFPYLVVFEIIKQNGFLCFVIIKYVITQGPLDRFYSSFIGDTPDLLVRLSCFRLIVDHRKLTLASSLGRADSLKMGEGGSQKSCHLRLLTIVSSKF
jgi:hypothetical protein